MPSEDTDERRLSPLHAPSMNPSYLTDEIRFPTERQVGFWNLESVPDHDGTEGMPLLHGGRHFIPLPLEKKLDLSSANPAGSIDSLQSHFLEEQKTKFSLEELVAARRIIGIHSTPWKHASSDFGHKSDLLIQPTNIYTKGNTVDPNVVHYENCLFSSSFSEIFNRKVSLASDDAFFSNSTDTIRLNFEEDVLPFGSLKEIEAQTIGDLLPDDDDLLEHIVQPSNRDDAEDDIFCTVGGIEIEEVDSSGSFNASDIPDETSYAQQGELNCSSVGEHPYGERPSRTLFVRNINSNVEDAELRNLFEKYGDIRTLYAVCKHRGFVMISYFDIRSACNAMRELQNMPLRHRKLDIHFSIPKSNPSEKDINQGTLVVLNLEPFVSDGDLRQIFGVHGEIKEICEVPQKNDLKLIEFYDIRATEAAVNALNMSYIAEKQITVEPFHRGVARQCMMQQRPPELQQDKIGRICNQSYPKNSPSGYGSISMGTSTFNNHDFGSVQGLNSVSQAPFSSIVVNKFNRIPSNSPQDFFPSRSSPIGNHSNQSFINSPGQKNDDFFHPHSLPQYHDKQSIPYNMESSTSAKAINIARSVESVGNRCMSVNSVSSSGFGGQNYGHSERAFGASGNSSYPASWHEYAWNNSFRSPSGTAIWPHSPSFTNNIPCLPSTELYGFPRAIHMLNTVSPATQYHVGSAPTADLSIWNRHQAYEVNPTDTSVFHPGSLGSKDFSSSPISNTNEHVSHNIFPHVSRTFMDPPMTAVHVGLPPPQQSCHIFYGREDMNSMPDAFNAHRDRVRCRRSDTSSNQADNKKEYELEIERIISGEDCRTTLMIKNIPNRYTSKMLLAAIDEHHRGTYDFIYLPIDFKNKCNVGYAFINMNDPLQIVPFHKTFSGKKWEKFNSEKVASLAYARIQGKAALVAHFQNSSLMNEDRRCRPIIFHSDGPNAGEQEPFPTGINIRSRPARSRSHKNEDDHDDVPSNSATDEISTGVIPSGPTIA